MCSPETIRKFTANYPTLYEINMKKIVQKILHPLSRQYRVEFIDAETLSSPRQYRIRPIIWIVSAVMLVFGAIVGTGSLIWYTPAIRQQIPGYTNPENEKNLMYMQSALDTLKKEIQRRDEFIVSLQRSLKLGDPIPSVTSPSTNTPAVDSKTNNAAAPKTTDKPDKVAQTKEPVKAMPQNDAVAINEMKPQPSPGDAAVGKNAQKMSLAIKTILRPVIGYIRDGFSPAKGHYGIDVVTNENETVLAATEGYVIFSEYTEADGHVIAVSNPTGVVTFYKHNSRLLKKKGSYVHAGEPIAVVGNTGENTTGPHLHFEMWYNGEPLNPRDYIIYK